MQVANEILIPEMSRLLNEGKEVRFTPSGVSMRPFIEGNKDSVVIAPLRRTLRVGDIVLANVTNVNGKKTYVLHRLVKIDGDQLILQGDGNVTGEERCTRAEVIGVVKRIEWPSGRAKWMTRGRVWYALRPMRKWLLKIYRHTLLCMMYDV